MAETTGIEWASATYNPWYGCRKVSAGCKNCYAERDMARYRKDFGTVTRSKTQFDSPIRWARNSKLAPGARIFTCSWSDWFIPDADPWREEAWAVIRATPQYNYLILTKRPELIWARLPADWGNSGYPNVWLGVSAEDQRNAEKRIPKLLEVPAAIHFVSAEPLLGPIDFERLNLPGGVWLDALQGEVAAKNTGCLVDADHDYAALDWIITGGESDPSDPRPMDIAWVRAIRDQCQRARPGGVSLFHKQNGGRSKIDGAWGGRKIDGITYGEFPWIKVTPNAA